MTEVVHLDTLDWVYIVALAVILVGGMLYAMTRVPQPRINDEPEPDDLVSRYRRHQGEDLR